MHGPSRRAGAVASIQNEATMARRKNRHGENKSRFIVGPGAEKFAVDEGFKTMDLLTDRSRIAWLAWKASL